VVRALEEGAGAVEPWDASRRTLAEGLRVPRLPGGRLVLAAVRATGGCAVAVTESDLLAALRRAARTDGFLACAEGAAALAAVVALRARGELEAARVLAFNTASIYKSPETLAAAATG
jgi:threonine synthase